MSIEAMKQALAWAYSHGEIVFVGGGMKAIDGMNAWARALRQAIEQAEKQEPVAWRYTDYKGDFLYTGYKPNLDVVYPLRKYERLYIAPQPQREWVGLTDEEINKCCDFPLNSLGMKHVRKIESKLKEKNSQ